MDPVPLDLREKPKDSSRCTEAADGKYVQNGTDEGELVTLESIPPGIAPTLRSIRLQFVEIDPEVLMESLAKCPNLESLELVDVDFTFTPAEVSASFSVNPTLRQEVTLPKLTSYKLRTGLNTEVGDYNRKDVFSSWIPFRTPPAIEDLVTSSLNFEFNGRDDGTILLINHDTHEIQSRLRWTNDLLKRLPPDFNCQKLVVFFCYAELDVGILPPSLVHIEFTGTVLRHGTLADLLLKTPHVQTLYLDGVHNGKRSDEPGQLGLEHLDKLSCLNALWLDHMVLSYSPNVSLPTITELVLDTRMENIGDQVIANFESIFPNLETVALVMHNQLVNGILEKILRLSSIRNIFLKTSYLRESESTWNLIESEELKSILLEINPEDDQYFTLKRTSGNIWKGTPVDTYGPFLKDFLSTPFVAFWD